MITLNFKIYIQVLFQISSLRLRIYQCKDCLLYTSSYLEFLDKYKNGLSQILYNSEDNINFDEALFYDLWSKETLFEDTFSDGPNYQIPLNIINEIIIDFKEPDYFNEKIVKNMFAIGLQDSGFLCFNPEDNSLCVLYPDGFITTIASSFDFFINNIKE